MIAFYLGAGDSSRADRAASQGLLLAVVHSIVMTIGAIAVMPVFLRRFTSSETVIDLGLRYSAVAFLFTIVIVAGVTFEKIFQGGGKHEGDDGQPHVWMCCEYYFRPRTDLRAWAVSGNGMEGAALATGIGQSFTLAIYLVVYLARPSRVRIRRQYLALDRKMVLKLYSIGIPASLNLALPSVLISSLNAILSSYSEVYILVLGIYYKLQTFLYLPANGIVQGMRPLIGFNYGAGEHKRVNQIYQIVLCMSGSIMILGTAICLIFPGSS